MRKRRRFKGTWFPMFGTEFEGKDPKFWGIEDTITFGNEVGSLVQLISPVPDEPTENFDDPDATLSDTVGSEYALQRFVGSFECFVSSSSGTQHFNTWTVALGFFVARADHNNPVIPIGANNFVVQALNDTPEGFDGWTEYSPLALSTIRQPWIWRREWRIQNQVNATEGSGPKFPLFPLSISTQGGGNLNAGHVDAKTRRRVRLDERLFAAIGIQPFPLEDYETADGSTTFTYRLEGRTYGALRKARGRSAF